ncbi:MAG: Nif3-like dinuclear metal center hexameric protein [Clostridia bacterium]|nr:Nif3-like dinuclear metal center hexameric protein [Clostridia bacterium]
MTVEEALCLLEKQVAPVKVSDDFCAKFKMYDNSGIIINCGGSVSGALFSLDLSEAAARQAAELGYNLIVTHHPAVYGGVSRFDLSNCAQSRALATCLKNGISVISMHLNFDAAPQGIDYWLMCGVGGAEAKVLAQVEGGGYGRVYSICPRTMPRLTQDLKETFSTNRIIVHGNKQGQISKIASFCGAGLDDNAIAFAKAENADAVVSSDLSHHRISELVESGIAVIQLTHYCAENYGFNKIYQKVKTKLQIPSSYFCDERFA